MKSQLLDIPLDLQELVCYSWFPVPPSLGTPDGFFNKTNKASMLHALVEISDEEIPFPSDAICIMDGNALFHSLTNLAPTMGGICKQILRAMVGKHDFVFSTDSYHEDSIKTHERIRRGISQKYIVDGPATKKPTEFKLFLSNDENKKQLCKLLLRVWSSDDSNEKISKCGTAILVVDCHAFQLKSVDGHVSINIRNKKYT